MASSPIRHLMASSPTDFWRQARSLQWRLFRLYTHRRQVRSIKWRLSPTHSGARCAQQHGSVAYQLWRSRCSHTGSKAIRLWHLRLRKHWHYHANKLAFAPNLNGLLPAQSPNFTGVDAQVHKKHDHGRLSASTKMRDQGRSSPARNQDTMGASAPALPTAPHLRSRSALPLSGLC